ncbi:DUF5996 family protein [Robiginitalea sp. SC105]|uniref:DUF5996 family protein n=1 Tax=Robiginitalea sp. SC105 TaxID=2762332 RepID=UPI00163AF545|nr:DUF5996 family protein [Robiginitalea sp. SC105]MBC2838576.1 hypothetical protein [Robiginitalea sp. SC105]
MSKSTGWPELHFTQMQDTIETLHQWIQIVGKIRLKAMPWQNHSWHVTLYVTTNGFSTHTIPYQGRAFQIDFDFKKHKLYLRCSDTAYSEMALRERTVADFYRELFEKLSAIGVDISIHGAPNEMDPAIPFARNTVNSAYDPDQVHALWQAMLRVHEVFSQFRSGYIGKVSPVHLFWGAFDLAVTRFSGDPAPLHQGGMPNMPLDVMQEAYSHEVSSAGFWPGSRDFPTPVFYAYAYPAGPGFEREPVQPAEAFYSPELGEFLLKYEDVRSAPDPGKTLMDFLQTTYLAAAKTGGWDRGKLEKHP